MLYLAVMLIFVFFAGIAMTVGEGFWSNAINLLAIVFAGLMGVVLGGPLGALMCEKFEKPLDFMWYFVFAATWLVFFASVLLFRIAAEQCSKIRVKFVPPLEAVAGPLMGIFVALMFTSFAAFTLLAMPIGAGEWDIHQASGWQQTVIQTGANLFISVAKACLGAEALAHLGV